ncbi:conserved membrane hypothetical protein [Gammaproteobacteria bacterium]
MFFLLPMILAGGAMAISGLRQRKNQNLAERLNADKDSSWLARMDERYQTLVERHLDPLLMVGKRSQQLKALSKGRERVLSSAEREANHALIFGVGALGLLSVGSLTGWPLMPLVLALGIFSTWPLIREAWRIAVHERRLSIMHLLLAYLAGLWLGGYYLIGVVGLIIGSLGQKIERLTQIVVRHGLTQLFGEQPTRVYVLCDGVELEIPFVDLKRGDILVLDAGQAVPIDGVIVGGVATFDQQRLTGESQPVDKGVGDSVLAGTLVIGGRVQVRVDQTGNETKAAQIAEMLNRTVDQQEVRIADKFRQLEWTRVPMLAGGAFGWLVGGPTMAVAIIGCNFLVSLIPLRLLTLMNGLQAGVERGILIKDGRALERLPEIDTVVFDKTGTLTLEQPEVIQIHAGAGATEAEVLRLAAAVEQRQTHPIARAILDAATVQGLAIPMADTTHYALGLGLMAQIEGRRIRLGSERFLAGNGLVLPETFTTAQVNAHDAGHALVFVAVEEEILGAIELAARVRPEADEVIRWLKGRGLQLYILSGDHEAPTARLAARLGMHGYFADTLPEQKADKIQALQAQGRRVCFIGDGINDAIALRQADASVSLRGATTVATDAAQVVLMDDHLSQLPLLWALAQGMQRNLDGNTRIATRFSLLAAGGVLLLPFKFWIVELGWFSQSINGIRKAVQPILPPVLSKPESEIPPDTGT